MIRNFQKTVKMSEQKFSIPENLGPVVLLHDEGSVGAVLTGSLLLDGAQDVPSFVENVLHDTAVPDFKAVWAGATLLEGNLGLLVPAVDDELVMVHKSLEGVWQKGSRGSSKEPFCCSTNVSDLWVAVDVEGKLVHYLLCYLFNTVPLQAVL